MKSRFWKSLLLASGLFAGALVLAVVLVPMPDFGDDFSTAVLDSRGQTLRVFLAADQQWRLPARTLPGKYQRALLCYEDRRYFYHPGIDPLSLLHAVYQCLEAGKFVRGASTIPMQVARLALPKERTPANKAFEMIQALKMSLLLSKKEILHLYATHAPMGGNTVGLEAACLRWFGKQPRMLSWAEAALLAVLPNSPSLISTTEGRAALLDKRNRLLGILHGRGRIDETDLDESLSEPLPGFMEPMPFEAPHAARWLREHIDEPIIETTLDQTIQRRTSAAVSNYLQGLKRFGISNAAVVVAETSTGEVRAYCGSQDFFSGDARGQVDGVRAPRSTGSVLKPFLYASLFDKGEIFPRSMIKDVPVFFGTFVPVNAGKEYSGMVSVRTALPSSLNIPAVMMLRRHGIGAFQDLLKRGGLTTLFRTPDDYGLPLILGGAEGTLWELCGLYRMLGRGGVRSPLRLTAASPGENEQEQRVLSPGACWQILEILKDLHRPGSEYYWRLFENQRPVAWKTGTSYGQRDAWAIGVSPRWTIGVWLGNFNGVGNPELGGAKTAGPLLFELFSLLRRGPSPPWFECPEYEMKLVDICRQSGFPCSPRCPDSEAVLAPETAELEQVCPYHQVFYMDRTGKYQVCSLCWGEDEATPDTMLIFPPDAVECMRRRGKRADELPRHFPTCPTQAGQNPISIVYPSPLAGLWIPRGLGGKSQKVVLKAAHSNAEAGIYWYVDGKYLGISRGRHQKAMALRSGAHQLTLVDDNGHRRRVDFTVGHRGE